MSIEDGHLDYSQYSYSELIQAKGSIDANKYPLNYQNLIEAIQKFDVPKVTQTDSDSSDSANWFWPDTSTTSGIRSARRLGAIACGYLALVNTLLISYSVFVDSILDLDAWSYVDPVIYALLGWRVYRGSVVASTLALAYFGIGIYLTYQETGKVGGIMLILISVMLINGVRGAFSSNEDTEELSGGPRET